MSKAAARIRIVWLGMVVAMLGVSFAHAQTPAPLLSEVRTIASDSLPVEKTFTLPDDGDYLITLTDFEFPAPIDAIKLAIIRGDTLVASLEATEQAHPFTATKGDYIVRVVGIPNTQFQSGSFGVEVTKASGAAVDTYSDVLSFIPKDTNGKGIISGKLTSSGGAYEVTLSDLQLPQALGTVTLGITRSGGTDVFTMNAPGTQTFTLPAGEYQVFAIGQAVTGETSGLFAVRVRSAATGEVAFTQTMSIGDVSLLGTATAAAGVHSLTLSDFAFPLALARSGVAIARDAAAAARLAAPGSTSFTASAGEYSIYVYAAPADATASGSYGVELRQQGGATVFSAAKAVGGAVGATPSYAFPIEVSAGGTYTVRLTDFEMPARFAVVSLAATQGGTLIGSLSSPDSLDLTLTPGKLFLLVIAQPSVTGGGLFGVDVTPSGGAALFEATQGVGALFDVRKVSITTAGKYNVGITDLKFPKRFVDLIGVVTRGAERKGSILGGGTFSFDATPGDYSINFIAQGALLDETKSSTQKAGTYAMTVAAATPAPTITLTLNPAQVRSGERTNITWSTTDADSCTATGGWSGTKQVSGTESSDPITASTTYAITCSGEGGSTTQSASVAVTSSARSGGGALEALTIAWLLGAATLSAMARRRRER